MRERNPEKTKRKIIQAFWSLYETDDLKNISVKRINETANINRSTFYEYFLDIYELIEVAEDDLLCQLKEPLLEISKGSAITNEAFLDQMGQNLYAQYGKRVFRLLGEQGEPSFREKFKCDFLPLLFRLHHVALPESIHPAVYEFSCSAVLGFLQYWDKCGINPFQIQYLEQAGTLLWNGLNIFTQK